VLRHLLMTKLLRSICRQWRRNGWSVTSYELLILHWINCLYNQTILLCRCRISQYFNITCICWKKKCNKYKSYNIIQLLLFSHHLSTNIKYKYNIHFCFILCS
jgi:hypothetical protein